MGSPAEERKALHERAMNAAVMVTPFGSQGSGSILHVERPDGSTGRYVATNAHVVMEADFSRPNGLQHDDQYFYSLRDQDGNIGFARLSSMVNTECSDNVILTDGAIDSALLEIIPYESVPEEVLSAYRPSVLQTAPNFTRQGWDTHAIRNSDVPPELLSGFAPKIWRESGTYTNEYAFVDQLPADEHGNHELIERDDKIRQGYSGSLVISYETGLPSGQVFAGDRDNNYLAFAMPIEPIAEQAVTIDLASRMFGPVYVTPENKCEKDSREWKDNMPEHGLTPISFSIPNEEAARER